MDDSAKKLIDRWELEGRIKRASHKIAGTYFFKCHNFVKIGYASDCRKRLFQCQTGNPYKLQFLYALPGNVENLIHNKLEDLHHQGDWFCIAGRLQDILEKQSIIPPDQWGA